MVDFIEEVDEQLRADRYRALARRTLPWFFAALAAIVVGWSAAAGYQYWRNQNIDKAAGAYDKAMTALQGGDETGAYSALDEVAKSGPAGYKTLALLQQGNIRLAADKSVEAVALYDAAAKSAPNEILGDGARLKAALALLDSAPYAQLETRLKPLIGGGKPFDAQAREALAFAELAAGKTTRARTDFQALTLALGATDEMRQRAAMAVSLIDSGQAQTAVDTAKLAATLPPPAPQTMQLPPGGQSAPAQQAAPSQPANRTAQ